MTSPLADSRREAILTASLELLDTSGVDAVTMARVGELTGLSRPAIYQYFTSREHILGELLINDMADLSNEIDRIVANEPDPMERVRLWIHYSLAHLASDEHRVVREISIHHLREEQRGELMAMHGFFLANLMSPLRELGINDPSAQVSIVFAAVHSAAKRIDEGRPFVEEAAALERFVTAGILAAVPLPGSEQNGSDPTPADRAY